MAACLTFEQRSYLGCTGCSTGCESTATHRVKRFAIRLQLQRPVGMTHQGVVILLHICASTCNCDVRRNIMNAAILVQPTSPPPNTRWPGVNRLCAAEHHGEDNRQPTSGTPGAYVNIRSKAVAYTPPENSVAKLTLNLLASHDLCERLASFCTHPGPDECAHLQGFLIFLITPRVVLNTVELQVDATDQRYSCGIGRSAEI
jgi:hypothetical protein